MTCRRSGARGSRSAGTSSARLAVGALAGERGDPVEQVPGAEPVGRGDGGRLAEPEPVSSAARWTSAGLSTLLATTITGCGAARSSAATSASPGPRPARASTTWRITSASAIASRAWCWTERESESSAARSTPPVSIRVIGTPFHSVVDLLAVARDAGLGVGDRLAPAGEPVDQRALAGVRVADDRDLHDPVPSSSPRSPAIAAIRSTTLVDAEARRVELDRVVGEPARGRRARARGRGRRGRAGRRERRRASSPASAARRRARSSSLGGQVDLQRRVGADDGADVASLRHPAAGGDQGALPGDHRRAHAGWTETREATADTSGVADRGGHVLAADRDPAGREPQVESLGEGGDRGGVVGVGRRRGASPARRSGTWRRSRGR